MHKTIGIGLQDFETIINNEYFYVDKTQFIKEWWDNGDSVTLITRPRRFGKTLTMNMTERFFSIKYNEKGDVFNKLKIWEDEKYRNLQGKYPVISLSFANIKERDFDVARKKLNELLTKLYEQNSFIKASGLLGTKELDYYNRISKDMDDSDATLALHQMSDFLSRYYDKKVIILLDEYDTPMQEAYVNGYWDEMSAFLRGLFNATFKTNPYMERGLMTGITRVSKESIFSDLNNLEVVTTTSDKYADTFGFNQDEVFAAMDEQGLADRESVKSWYDGFTFGDKTEIYNPWSIINYLDKRKLGIYWANTSSNSLIGKLIREGSRDIKESFEDLMKGQCLYVPIDEQIVYDQLNGNQNAVWSLLLASGYLKVLSVDSSVYENEYGTPIYGLALTNGEVRRMFAGMIKSWFEGYTKPDYNDFIKALLLNDVDAMNEYMNRISAEMFSSFDTGKHPAEKAEPERFYHGFVLGLVVELADQYSITSNRESGFGRYDVILEPKNSDDDAYIIEFKVFDKKKDKTLEQTVVSALNQIDEKQYETNLLSKGIPSERIKKYGFAFEGKKVLIGTRRDIKRDI